MIIARDIVEAMGIEFKEEVITSPDFVESWKLIKPLTIFDLYPNGPFISEVVIRDENTKGL
jgi:hypothetical protein